jgi:hypothetical protein
MTPKRGRFRPGPTDLPRWRETRVPAEWSERMRWPVDSEGWRLRMGPPEAIFGRIAQLARAHP